MPHTRKRRKRVKQPTVRVPEASYAGDVNGANPFLHAYNKAFSTILGYLQRQDAGRLASTCSGVRTVCMDPVRHVYAPNGEVTIKVAQTLSQVKAVPGVSPRIYYNSTGVSWTREQFVAARFSEGAEELFITTKFLLPRNFEAWFAARGITHLQIRPSYDPSTGADLPGVDTLVKRLTGDPTLWPLLEVLELDSLTPDMVNALLRSGRGALKMVRYTSRYSYYITQAVDKYISEVGPLPFKLIHRYMYYDRR